MCEKQRGVTKVAYFAHDRDTDPKQPSCLVQEAAPQGREPDISDLDPFQATVAGLAGVVAGPFVVLDSAVQISVQVVDQSQRARNECTRPVTPEPAIERERLLQVVSRTGQPIAFEFHRS